jgi:hypothetical protein
MRIMRGNPLGNFHRAAEAAGYPALLIVAMACLGLVVAPVALLALTKAGWVLALALLSLALAVFILAGAIGAAFADANRSIAGRGTRASRPPCSEPRSRHWLIASRTNAQTFTSCVGSSPRQGGTSSESASTAGPFA